MLDGSRYVQVQGATVDVAGDAVALRSSAAGDSLEHTDVADCRCGGFGFQLTTAARLLKAPPARHWWRRARLNKSVPARRPCAPARSLRSRSAGVRLGPATFGGIRYASLARLEVNDSLRGLAVQLR